MDEVEWSLEEKIDKVRGRLGWASIYWNGYVEDWDVLVVLDKGEIERVDTNPAFKIGKKKAESISDRHNEKAELIFRLLMEIAGEESSLERLMVAVESIEYEDGVSILEAPWRLEALSVSEGEIREKIESNLKPDLKLID